MNTIAHQLLRDALRLPDGDRADLAAHLIESLDVATDRDAEAAWDEEIKRRLADLDQRVVQTIPWTEARRMILGQADGRPSH